MTPQTHQGPGLEARDGWRVEEEVDGVNQGGDGDGGGGLPLGGGGGGVGALGSSATGVSAVGSALAAGSVLASGSAVASVASAESAGVKQATAVVAAKSDQLQGFSPHRTQSRQAFGHDSQVTLRHWGRCNARLAFAIAHH